MNIIQMKIGDIYPYQRNAKKHERKQIDNVAESIRQFGMVQPIVVDKDNNVIIGHCRLMACKKLKKRTVPVVKLEELTPEEANKLRLLDNKLNESEWDFDLLSEDIPTLDFDGYDIDWEIPNLKEDEEGEIAVEEDEFTEEVPSICQSGDKWVLGDHILYVGSSTSPDDVKNLMQDDRARILFTSPPYSDLREYNGGKNLDVDNIASFIQCYRPYTDYQCVNLGLIRKNEEIIPYWDEYISTAKDAGYKLMAWNVWDKTMCGSIGQQSAFIPIRHEWIFVFGTKAYDINRTKEKKSHSERKGEKERGRLVRQADGTTKRSSLGDVSHKFKMMESVSTIVSETGTIRSEHPAVFPVALPSEYIQALTNEGDIIIEPFGGSGTTLIACEQLNRRCRIMELDCHYADVIVRRWENLTGRKAVKADG